MRKITLLVSAFMLTVATTVAQTWDIGTPNAGDLTATLSDGTLTISGKGAMQDFSGNWYSSDAPWYSVGSSIGKLVIEEGITSIGNYAFFGRGNTGSLIIPEGVTRIGDYAFGDISSYSPSFTGTLIIPNSVTSIGSQAFSQCHGFTGTLIIPESVETIGSQAFFGCKGFTGSITIPERVTTIGNAPFYTCSGLTAINVSASNPNYSSDNGILYNKDKTTLIQCPGGKPGAIVILESVKIIGMQAFSWCQNLTGSLTIPSGVTTIESNAFSYCTGINSVSNFAIVPQTISGGFGGLTLSNIPLYVPYESLAKYQAASIWKEFNIIGRYYTINATAGNDAHGTVNCWYNSNETATFTATPAAGYEFVNWTKNGVAESSENPYTFTVTGDVELVANFRKIETSINYTPSNTAVIVGYYSFSGVKLLQEPERGMYIVVYGDGRREKVFKR